MKIIILLLIAFSLNAQIGIGTTTPTEMLDVNGTTKTIGLIMTTNPVQGYVLTSDINGRGTWQQSNNNVITGVFSNLGVNIPSTTTQYLQTNSTITLPPGRYAIHISILIRLLNTNASPNNSSYWLRSSFSDSNLPNPVPSTDIIGGRLASGSLNAASYYGLVNGVIIINNQSTISKTYYYIAGNVTTASQNVIIQNFATSGAGENKIIAYKIN